MRAARNGAVIGSLLLAGALARAAEPRWIHLKSANFEMFSTAGERSSRDTLRHFERVRGFFLEAMPGLQGNLPVRLVVFGSERDYAPYRINDFAVAYYLGGGEYDYIVLGTTGERAYPVAIHEYVHLLVRHSGITFPVWMNEGMAELYSTLQPSGDKVVVGNLVPGRYQELLRGGWLPLAQVLGVERDSPLYNEKDKAGGFYNQSWALMHMLALSEEYRPRFSEFLKRIVAGTPSDQALAEAYGRPLKAIEGELRGYIRGDSFRGLVFPVKLQRSNEALPAGPAPEYELRLALADLLYRPGRAKEAEEMLESLAVAEPGRPEALAALGYLAWRGGRVDEARRRFAQAVASGSRSPKLLWDYGRLTAHTQPEQARQALARLLEIQPQRDDARIELAFSYVLRQEGKEALESLAPVKRISPGLAPRLFEVMAYAHLAAGNRQEARSAARRWQETAGEDAKPRAEAMLRLIDAGSEFSVASPDVGVVGPEEPVSPERPALRRAPLAKDDLPPLPETGTTAGELVQVECASAELRLVVATADGERTFALEDPAKVTVVGVPGGVLELNCGAQSPRSVRLEYEPMKPPRAGVAGAVRILEFLPAAQKLP